MWKAGFSEGIKHESREGNELFRATLGFDFIFVRDEFGNKHPMCVELNGSSTGIFGMEDIPDEDIDKTQKIVSRIRSQYDQDFMHKQRVAREIANDMDEGTFPVSEPVSELIYDLLKRSLKKGKLIKHSLRNPPFIEQIARSKRFQETYVPKEMQPRVWHEGDSPESSTGYWVCKPNTNKRGEGIRILSNEDFLTMFVRNKEVMHSLFTVQEFHTPSGAENAGPEDRNNPSSLRLLIDFQYLDDGTIKPLFKAGYQRVSTYPPGPTTYPDTAQEVFIVNKSTGAKSVAASDHEMLLASQAAERIIRNIGEAYRDDAILKAQREDIVGRLQVKIDDLQQPPQDV